MKFNGVPFYFFPTTVLLVDDSERFLESISFKLDEKLAYRAYDKPYQALQYLKEEYFNQVNKNIIQKDVDDLEQIFTRLYSPNRFNEISVVLVDYSMPSMTGVEFCRQIKHLPFKKILVTGEAENDLAVKAFNEGVIDKFIRKDNLHFAEEINRMIAQLQWQYFQEKFISDRRETKDPMNFYNDSVFVEYFEELCEEQQIIEYYLIDKTNYILFDIDAKSTILNVNYLKEGSLLSQKPRTKLGHIFSENYSQYSDSFKMLKGKHNYCCTIKRTPVIGNMEPEKIVSYRSYLGL